MQSGDGDTVELDVEGEGSTEAADCRPQWSSRQGSKYAADGQSALETLPASQGPPCRYQQNHQNSENGAGNEDQRGPLKARPDSPAEPQPTVLTLLHVETVSVGGAQSSSPAVQGETTEKRWRVLMVGAGEQGRPERQNVYQGYSCRLFCMGLTTGSLERAAVKKMRKIKRL